MKPGCCYSEESGIGGMLNYGKNRLPLADPFTCPDVVFYFITVHGGLDGIFHFHGLQNKDRFIRQNRLSFLFVKVFDYAGNGGGHYTVSREGIRFLPDQLNTGVQFILQSDIENITFDGHLKTSRTYTIIEGLHLESFTLEADLNHISFPG